MDHKNLDKLTVSSDACRHMRPRLCIEMVRAWNTAEKASRKPLTWSMLIDLFNARSPNPHAEEIRKSRDAILSAAAIDKLQENVMAAFDARKIGDLYPSKKAHEAMRVALFDPKMAAGGKNLYELFFHDLELSDCAGTVHRTYGKMLAIVERGVAEWPLGKKLAEQILEIGLARDGLTLAQLRECVHDGKKTFGDAKLESASHHGAKFLFVFPLPRVSHA